MLCLKKRRTYSFTQGACNDIPRRSTKEKNGYNETLNMAVTTLPRKHRSREERSSGGMVLTVTEDTPADMLAGSMELLVQLPRDHNVLTQRVTVPRSTPMMDLLVQIATAHKLSASSYTLQAIGERGLVLPHQPNTPIGALDALQVKLLPKQGTFLPRKAKQANQPFETTFRLQVLLPRNQLYVSRVSPKMNLGKILDEVCREKNLDKNKYELRHPANLDETLDLSLSLQDYHLQEVTLYAKQGRTLGAALSSQDIMALQRQEERRRQQAKQSVFGFMFRKSKDSSLSIDSLGGRSVSPARSDETGRSVSPLAPPPPPSRPQRKRRQAPKPPVQTSVSGENDNDDEANDDDDEDDNDGDGDGTKEKLVISHSRNSSDSSGYHEASVLSDNPDSSARMPETLPRRSKQPCKIETSRKLAHTSQSSKSLGNLAMASGGLSHGISSTSISSTGIRKKRAAPPPPIARPLSSAISSQALERIIDSEESLTSDIDISKSPSDIATSSKANSDIGVNSKANSDIGVHSMGSKQSSEIGYNIDAQFRAALADHEDKSTDIEINLPKVSPSARLKASSDVVRADVNVSEFKIVSPLEKIENVEIPRLVKRATGDHPTETDILLQKVSDTLSNSLPVPEPPLPPDIVATTKSEKITKIHATETDESDGICETLEICQRTNEPKSTLLIETKNHHESASSTKSNVPGSSDVTLNSQQDTSDYVSATGDDLSITDWEYQLPAPPSAFRDNISPEFDGYDTITLRSIEAFKEQSANTPEHEKIPILDLASCQSTILTPKEIVRVDTISPPIPEIEIAPSTSTESSFQREKPKSSLRLPAESRNVDASAELRKDIISELSTKIENGSLTQTSGKISEQEIRRTTAESSAPKIAPVDNTLSNFTITTYSRQKSLDIFENEEINVEKRNFPKFTNLSKNIQDSETFGTSKATIDSGEEKFSGKNPLKKTLEDDISREEKLPATREQREEHNIAISKVEFEKPEEKIHFTQNDSLLRSLSVSKGSEKLTNVHRSKSYITLANNFKYREDSADDERLVECGIMEIDEGRMMKSTSVTNLNHDPPRNNEKFSQWRENILKRQEEPSKEKQLQSLQVLKNILPRLRSNQQTDESVSDSSNERENSNHTGRKTLPEAESIEAKSAIQETRILADEPAKSQKTTEDTATTTTKRYKYTGPPAISLGSWSERPRVNVQLKMDNDYKFATSHNTSGPKTCVNLNGTSTDKSNVEQRKIEATTLPRNFAKIVKESNGSVDNREIERRESDDQLAKKLITHTTATGFKKPSLNRIVFSEVKKISRNNESDIDVAKLNNDVRPVVTSVELKKRQVMEKTEERVKDRSCEDDVKIDTKSVNFRDLAKTFGQEVCLRTKPRNVLQNRHSDYYGARPDILENSSVNNGQTNFWPTGGNKSNLKHSDSTRNPISNGIHSVNNGVTKRYTSVVGIPAQSCYNNNNKSNNVAENGESIAKNYTTSTMMNGSMPVVKGFKLPARQTEASDAKQRVGENVLVSRIDSLRKISNVSASPPPPPTMPIITGVTLKNSTARPKSMPIGNNDSRDQLFESIRSFGGRDGLKSVLS